MRFVIPGNEIKTEHDLDALLGAPLDAWLHEAERPVEVVWQDAEASYQALGGEVFDRLLQYLIEARDDNDGVTFELA